MWEWSAFLDLADELVNRPDPDEAATRSAISRAYYAVFGTARNHLIQRGIAVPKAGPAHRLVWDHFHAAGDPAHRRISNLGRTLRMMRGQADYDDAYPDLERDAERAAKFARRLLSDLDSLP